jgi:hypothetical protein
MFGSCRLGPAFETAVAIACLLLFAAPPRAAAYCRASVETSPLGACDDRSDVPLLHWTRGCVQYAFHRDFFERMPELTEQVIRADYASAFEAYRTIDCGRRAFEAVQLPELASAGHAEFLWDVRNESLMAVRSAREWQDLDYDDQAIALTLLFFDPDDGEIYDVDMELNAGAGRFIHCDGECGAGEIDLPSTLIHEVGHYLGLGHSTVQGSTMLARADRTLDRRSLEADDRDGYCALDLPEPELVPNGPEPRCDAPKYSQRLPPAARPATQPDCSMTHRAGDRSGFGTATLLAAAALWTMARRRR